MYYIYEERIAFVETEANGVVAVPFPKAKNEAEEMMNNAKSRYSMVRSLPRASTDAPKKLKNVITTKYAEGTPEDFDNISTLTVPSAYFVLGPNFKQYRVDEDTYNEFMKSLKTYKITNNKRKIEVSNMTYSALLEFFLSHPLSKSKKDALLIAISNIYSRSTGPDPEPLLDNRQTIEVAYYILRGLDESGDDSTLNNLLILGAADSLVQYKRDEETTP